MCDSLGLPLIDSLPVEPSPVVDWSLEGLESFKAHNAHVSAVHELVDALQVRPGFDLLLGLMETGPVVGWR